MKMWKSRLEKENEDLRQRIIVLEKQIKDQREEILWAEGEIDFLNDWQDPDLFKLRPYERILRYVFS